MLVLGLALSGTGASLQPPTSPTDKPYSPNCHALLTRVQREMCFVVAATGSVAGVVEEKTGVTEATSPPGTGLRGQ